MYPLFVMTIGILLVIWMIMWLRVHAFIALITAAMVVSFLAVEPIYEGMTPETLAATPLNELPEPDGYQIASDSISRVAVAFGEACGNIGIVIALAAVIGTLMMDSGAADRVVRAFMKLLGEKRAPIALLGSGYVLAVPVFFDTVFYLLVPLARAFYRRTGANYLKCILAITAGGAITHTLVPPTPGPLTMAATLGIDLGKMILVGAIVALPAAIAGIMTASFLDRLLNIPMREIEGHEEPDPLDEDQLPGLFVSVLPVILPVIMIACHTASGTLANSDGTAIGQFAAEANHYTSIFGNPNFALLVSTGIAIWVFLKQRSPTKEALARLVDISLMRGGEIILITPGGASFGAMLKVAEVGTAISNIAESWFGGGLSGILMLFVGFGIAVVLKVAQGSSTAAMIITSAMLAPIVLDPEFTLSYDTVYLATAIGAGSLVGSWMNDSGFWIFTKMGGLTEAEGLKTWTPLLAVLGIVSMVVTLILAIIMPLT
ncbi:MAG: gluconate permease [Planctomycetaceae bacterium]|nr:gluconate permease [Planctomycetaceae bacterium]